MNNRRYLIIIIILLILTIGFSFAFPRTKYSSINFLSETKIPTSLSGWNGEDVSNSLGISEDDAKYNFISEAAAYQYNNKDGKKLLFIILDAGNFHHPKNCFTGAGFKTRELDDTIFQISDRSFKAHTLFTEKGSETFLSFYWISIDKDIAHEWIKQKIKQLMFSLSNKKRVGLMMRIDIPSKEHEIEDSIKLARQFVKNISAELPLDQAEYIFGKK
jgi:EpsI family protein